MKRSLISRVRVAGPGALAVLLAGAVVPTSQDATAPRIVPDAPKACSSCIEWNQPQAPFRIFGNTYYVGTRGLSSILVTSPEGHALIDGGLPQSAARIDENIRGLGFRTEDVKVILNSHAHFDHAGGIAALQRFTGARVLAGARGAQALERGTPLADDPQFGLGDIVNSFPKVSRAKVVLDREIVRVGPLRLTARLTPGHTKGGVTWTWRSCEGARCLNVVHADSLTAVSADGYFFTGAPVGRPLQPSVATAFRESIDRVARLPCDIVLSPHPASTRLFERTAGQAPLIDASGCRVYAENARREFEARAAKEEAEKTTIAKAWNDERKRRRGGRGGN